MNLDRFLNVMLFYELEILTYNLDCKSKHFYSSLPITKVDNPCNLIYSQKGTKQSESSWPKSGSKDFKDYLRQRQLNGVLCPGVYHSEWWPDDTTTATALSQKGNPFACQLTVYPPFAGDTGWTLNCRITKYKAAVQGNIFDDIYAFTSTGGSDDTEL